MCRVSRQFKVVTIQGRKFKVALGLGLGLGLELELELELGLGLGFEFDFEFPKFPSLNCRDFEFPISNCRRILVQ